jgi:hypothetical protein
VEVSKGPTPLYIMTDKKLLVNVEYIICLSNMITNEEKCTREIKSRIDMAREGFNSKKTLFIIKLDLNLRKKLFKCYIWSIALYGTETWTLRKEDQEYWKVLKCGFGKD